MPRKKIPLDIAKSLDGVQVTPKDKILSKEGMITLQEYYKSNAGASVERSEASRDLYKNYESNLSVRNGFNRCDYEAFRPDEAMPRKQKEVVQFCMQAYKKVGLLHNVIDLMADFAGQGITIHHPNPKWQKFLRKWFKKVRGVNRTERFLNLLYRAGNVIVNRMMMKISPKEVSQYQSSGSINDIDIQKVDNEKIKKRVIPGRYTLLNPLTVEKLSSEISQFVGHDDIYILKISEKLRRIINNPANDIERKIVSQLPVNLLSAIQKGERYIVLDSDKISVFYYKKDDWEDWADPMTFCILDDLLMLEKMKLADLAALDGAISQIRLWILGSLEYQLFPGDGLINKLADILLSNTGGGAFDIIWGPGIELIETGTDVHNFLGSKKYEPVWLSIYQGLGIPQTLTGSEKGGGFTNNFISMQTLIRRLEYGREVITEFWENELALLKEALGFREDAYITFDRMVLSDESAERALLVQLVDRDILSEETLIERFGEIPELEMIRRHRENREREKGKLPNKAGPWHHPQQLFELMKIALQQKLITPGEANLTDVMGDKRDGEKSGLELDARNKNKMNLNKKGKGQPQQGRPLNSKDTVTRKQKSLTPRTTASSTDDIFNNLENFMTNLAFAKKAQDKINEIYNKEILSFFNKKDFRSLTAEEYNAAEKVKFTILSKCYNEEDIENIDFTNINLENTYATLYDKFYNEAKNKQNMEPTLDYCRNIQCIVHAFHLSNKME